MFFTVSGVAITWSAIAVLVQRAADIAKHRSPISIMPPRWWWYSPVPWPHSLLAALLFAVVAAGFMMLAVRSGMRSRHLLFGMGAALAVLWASSLADNFGFLTHFGALQGVAFVKMDAPVRLSGTFGSVLGSLFAVLAISHRRSAPLPASST